MRHLPVFLPGRRWFALALGAAVLGLGLTALRIAVAPAIGLASYLVAFTYWLGLSLGALILLMIFHASHARWPVVIRRWLEVIGASIAIFPLLFLPIAIGLSHLYPWAGAQSGMDAEAQELIAHRAPFLNPTFFIIRAAVYFIVWSVFAIALFRVSRKQDSGLHPELTACAWKLGAAGLPVMGVTLTLASVDWLMSLSVRWFSSLWGIYYFAGSFVAAIALAMVVVLLAERLPSFAGVLRPTHVLSLGKLLFAFVCFWAYIAFSQYLLVWIANLPEEASFILTRSRHGWGKVGVALAIGHFALPFFLLLPRQRKTQRRPLIAVALLILIMHAVDLCWVVMPQLRPEAGPHVDWSVFSSLLGVGGVAFAFGLWLLRGRYTVPLGDPFLKASLEYART